MRLKDFLRSGSAGIAGWLIMLLGLPAALGCSTLDVSQPIELAPGDDFDELQVEALRNAADCWNLAFGTHLEVGNSGTVAQQVEIAFNDFACVFGLARTETNFPVKVNVCPSYFSADAETEYFSGNDEIDTFFYTMLHELGHVLNIRTHGEDPGSVMGHWPMLRFTDEDQQLFYEANEGFDEIPPCSFYATLIIERRYPQPPYCDCAE